jgi:hypothetical protein
MNSVANGFRGKAHEAQVMELETHDPYLRRVHAKVATHWLQLAERTEREELASAIRNSAGMAGSGLSPETSSLSAATGGSRGNSSDDDAASLDTAEQPDLAGA